MSQLGAPPATAQPPVAVAPTKDMPVTAPAVAVEPAAVPKSALGRQALQEAAVEGVGGNVHAHGALEVVDAVRAPASRTTWCEDAPGRGRGLRCVGWMLTAP